MDSYRIVWSDKLRMGNELIDAQHKNLIEKIASIPEHETDEDEALLSDVLQYAATHFSDEEKFMEQIGYPELPQHQRKHKVLTHTLLAYKRAYENGEKDLYSFKQFMFRWVRDHIMDEDREIAVFLKSKEDDKPSV